MSELASEPVGTAAPPVLVVGAGPVGLAAALLLARHRVPSVLLEAAPHRQTIGSRSICVQRDVLDILDRVGAGRSIVDAGVTWYTGRIYFREHEVATITFPRTGAGEYPPFVNISQTDVELLLERRVLAEPLVDLRYGHRVTGIEQAATGVRLHTSTVDGPRSFAGTHCVAADGARSTVRALLGLPFPGHSFDDQFLITDIRARLDFPVPERRFYFDPPANPGRQVLLHPQPDSVWRIDWQVPDGFDLDTDRAAGGLERRVRAIVGAAGYEPVWLSVYRFHQRRVPAMVCGRVLLAGDAAHVMSPFGARGMNSGIADAENAAWKIAVHRAGEAGPALLDSYDHERGAAAAENLRVTGRTMRFLVPRTEAERAHRTAVLERSVHDPAARAEIDSGKLSEPFWYLDSPLTTPADPVELAGFPTAPGVARPPLPGVLCPDLPCSGGARLRSVLGTGFTVLAGSRAGVGGVAVPDEVARALRFGPHGAALVRPDGYLAAVLAGDDLPAGLAAARRRACGW
ncbi:MAG TPA: FAD-dependent monooxygenase [Actinophytocola sp.]|uniref:FAD-dependent monooxygenase n=1 Tax=Actinophytocola sp. TaxID=1872138 RepID=UPI002DBF9855|nr:FAD-dependent monooxygenase [Actinophytocola sp.]HEU5471562.1 FAD-dependent monooxygenase [Actinophytocola sp.]